ncbi:MAG: hypothetical protein ACTSX7_17425, partial [Alphaproteobacteria bacterium]
NKISVTQGDHAMAQVKVRIGILAILAGILAACSTVVATPGFPELTYSHLQPIRLDVSTIEIVDAYAAPLREPNVEHRAPARPAVAANQWAEDRLVAAGSSRRAVFTIKEASIIETKLEPTGGLKGVFTKDQSERYDATLLVDLAIIDTGGTRRGSATATATRSRTVPENITLNERERIWFQMVEGMMADLNRELEKAITQSLKKFTL